MLAISLAVICFAVTDTPIYLQAAAASLAINSVTITSQLAILALENAQIAGINGLLASLLAIPSPTAVQLASIVAL